MQQEADVFDEDDQPVAQHEIATRLFELYQDDSQQQTRSLAGRNMDVAIHLIIKYGRLLGLHGVHDIDHPHLYAAVFKELYHMLSNEH